MDDPRHTDPATTDTIDADGELPFDDLEDLEDPDCLEPPGGFAVPDELEHLGGYSESTAEEDPPPE